MQMQQARLKWIGLTWLHLVSATLGQIQHERVRVLLHDSLEFAATARALPAEIVREEDILRVCVDILSAIPRLD